MLRRVAVYAPYGGCNGVREKGKLMYSLGWGLVKLAVEGIAMQLGMW